MGKMKHEREHKIILEDMKPGEAIFKCNCGFVFIVPPLTSVICPNCGNKKCGLQHKTTQEINDGGPAFPGKTISHYESIVCKSYEETEDGRINSRPVYNELPGMSMRDYFAARATEKDIENFIGYIIERGETRPLRALPTKYTRQQARYRYADAMIFTRGNEWY